MKQSKIYVSLPFSLWYNDSADAEFKPAKAVLPALCAALYSAMA